MLPHGFHLLQSISPHLPAFHAAHGLGHDSHTAYAAQAIERLGRNAYLALFSLALNFKGLFEAAFPPALILAGIAPQATHTFTERRILGKDKRHDVIAHAVTLPFTALIAGILEPRNAKAFQHGNKMFLVLHKQGAQEAAASFVRGRIFDHNGAHTTKAGPASATSQAHEHIFGKVSAMMGGKHPLCPNFYAVFLKEGVTSAAARLFDTTAPLFGKGMDILTPRVEGHSKFCAELSCGFGLGTAFFAQAVVKMCGMDLKPQVTAKGAGHHKKGRRICTAGKSHKEARAVKPLMPSEHELFLSKAYSLKGHTGVLGLK